MKAMQYQMIAIRRKGPNNGQGQNTGTKHFIIITIKRYYDKGFGTGYYVF